MAKSEMARSIQMSSTNQCVCVCVCQPLGQGFPTATSTPSFTGRGAVDRYHSLPNEDSDSPVVKSRKDAFWTYLLRFFASCHPTFPRFDSWSFHMIPSPQTGFPTADLQPTCNHTDCQSANIVQPYSSRRLFRHAVPSPFFPTW